MHQKTFKCIEPGALAALGNHTWPGNIRELENVIQKSTIVGAGDTIRKEDLGLKIAPDDDRQPDNIVCIGDYEPAGSFELKLRDFKIRVAEAAVRENNGNKSQAARSLNISRAYLYHLIGLADDGMVPEENSMATTQFEQAAACQI
jgi:DNA-binding NtrC family response regulator